MHTRINHRSADRRSVERHQAEVETALYRITQEALINACVHGHAERALVEVREDHNSVQVAIRDNGHGFDPAGQTDGFGLLAMRERAEVLDGTLEIDSAPGFGTTVTATIPIRGLAFPAVTATHVNAGDGGAATRHAPADRRVVLSAASSSSPARRAAAPGVPALPRTRP